MFRFIISLSFALFLFHSCLCQVDVNANHLAKDDTIKSIDTTRFLDPIELAPFHIVRKSDNICLSNKFSKIKKSGFCVIKLSINPNSMIETFEISKILLKKGDSTLIDYSTKDNMLNYSKEVGRLRRKISHYLETNILITPNLCLKPTNSTIMYLLIRFR